jgi:hypothetical protein
LRKGGGHASLEELTELAARLGEEYEPRFAANNRDLSIGRMRSLITRGIGFEVDGEWDSIHAARFSLFRRRWIVERDLPLLEAELRAVLEKEIEGGPVMRSRQETSRRGAPKGRRE